MQIAEMEAKNARTKSKQSYDKDVEEHILHPVQLVLLHILIEGKFLATYCMDLSKFLRKKEQ